MMTDYLTALVTSDMLMVKDREILDLKGSIAEMLAVGSSNGISSIMNSLGVGSIGGGMSAAPGGFPATTRSSASSGLFTPYSHHSSTEAHHHGGEIGVLDLPAGTELSKLAGLGLDTIESSTAVTRYDENIKNGILETFLFQLLVHIYHVFYH